MLARCMTGWLEYEGAMGVEDACWNPRLGLRVCPFRSNVESGIVILRRVGGSTLFAREYVHAPIPLAGLR